MPITTVIPRRGINDDGLGKKHALRKLIAAATTEYVYLSDDDVVPPAALPETDADLVIMPLRMQGGKRLVEQLQIAEYAAIQQLTIESARRGHAVMCSGANLLVRRDRWLESAADLHPEIPSGDDMFLLESFKRRGLRIEVVDAPEFEATVTALPTWRALFRQRMRWAGKAAHYTDRDIRVCGMLIVLSNCLQLLLGGWFLLKFPIDLYLVRRRDTAVSFWVILLLGLFYPYYMLICLIGGWLHPQRW